MSDGFDWIERDRGILTKRDREILTGDFDEDLTENALYQRYYNIRNRIKNAIIDFHLLSRHLPLRDIQQVFDPAYDWSRERRHLNEQGRSSTTPDLSVFLQSWMNLFEFYAYGMLAGDMEETRELMRGLIIEGLERGIRGYQFENYETYQDISYSVSVEYGKKVFQENYLRQIQRDLPNEADEAAKQVMDLYRQKKIPYQFASQLIEHYVQSPESG
jgi:hypothetical protein